MTYSTDSIENRKERIFQATIHLLKTHPSTEINISELCKLANVSRMYYYRHYSSIDDVIQEKLDKMFQQYTRLVKKYQTKESNIFRLLFFKFFRQIKDELAVLLQSDLKYVVNYAFKQYLSQLLQQNLLTDPSNKEIGFYRQNYVAAGLTEVLSVWILTGAKESDTEMSEIIYKITRNFI